MEQAMRLNVTKPGPDGLMEIAGDSWSRFSLRNVVVRAGSLEPLGFSRATEGLGAPSEIQYFVNDRDSEILEGDIATLRGSLSERWERMKADQISISIGGPYGSQCWMRLGVR